MPSAVFVVAHDSQFKWAASVAACLGRRDWSVAYVAPVEHTQISPAQMADAGVDPALVKTASERDFIPYLAGFDAVFLPTPGAITERYLHRLRAWCEAHERDRRPVMVTSYVGLVVDNHTAGYLYRAAADVVCVNSDHDHEIFTAASKALGIDPGRMVVSGLAIIPSVTAAMKTGPIRQMVFADQVAIPKAAAERRIVYQRVLEYAVAHPERRVVVKPRHRPDEGSFHTGTYPPETFFQGELPANLSIDYTPVTDLLPATDLLVTVSSTAALEALAHGVRVAIISDIGVKEVHGNHMFIGSGLIRSFPQIMHDDIGEPDEGWLKSYSHAGTDANAVIADAVERAYARIQSGDLTLPQSPYFNARRDMLSAMQFDRTGRSADLTPFERRLRTYGPLKRSVVQFGRTLLPDSVATPIYRSLKSRGIL